MVVIDVDLVESTRALFSDRISNAEALGATSDDIRLEPAMFLTGACCVYF